MSPLIIAVQATGYNPAQRSRMTSPPMPRPPGVRPRKRPRGRLILPAIQAARNFFSVFRQQEGNDE